MTNQTSDDLEAEIARLSTEKAQPKAEPENSPEQRFARVLDQHVSCLDPVMFIRRRDKAMLTDKAFDKTYATVVNAIVGLKPRYLDHAAKYATAATRLKKVKGISYRPGQPDIGADGLFNMWRAPAITPLDEKPLIFFEHMKYLIPNPHERMLAVKWLAWAVQRPNEKLMFALLLFGAGGTGKSWLGKLFEVIFGEDNVTLLEDEAPLKSDFQEFKLHKRLLVINEIAPDDKIDLVNSLKGFITEGAVRINQKGIARVKVENFCNLLAITNIESALKIARKDRRWLCVECAADVWGADEDGNETAETEAYYTRLFDCIGTPGKPGDEARRILNYLMKVKITEFNGKGLAPATSAKDEVAAASETETKSSVAESKAAGVGPFKHSLFTVAEVVGACTVKQRSGASVKVMEAEAAKAMMEVGCRKVVIEAIGKGQQVSIQGKPVRLWAGSKAAAARYGKMAPDELRDIYTAEHRTDAGPDVG